ncbi:MAG: ribosome-binding factor A [Chloroflexi bacterium HGW-Chloroflexi-6]|nr:MAG: ribosome-binding factor A [Chloroflexi bacterium HGW-Chloroflexi-6]
MPSGVRLQRISDRVRQELSAMLLKEINDPRLAQIFVTDVTIDRELAYANIYVSAIEGASRSKEILEGLESASGFLRRELAARVDLRAFPRLRFHWDPTPENAEHMERLFKQLKDEEKK